VVLPFQKLGGDPADDYLADGITEDLTSDLSRRHRVLSLAAAANLPNRHQAIRGGLLRDARQQSRFRTASTQLGRQAADRVIHQPDIQNSAAPAV
jgi:hypothetical protein